jgi:hypothetical protein
VLTYWLAVFALRGADAMQWHVSHGKFVVVWKKLDGQWRDIWNTKAA